MENRVPSTVNQLPLRTETDAYPSPVLVWTELGVKIYLDPRKQEYSAAFGTGRDQAQLHSTDLNQVIQRIRERALVIPMRAYVITEDRIYGNRGVASGARVGYKTVVHATEVVVVEYHKGRQEPWVAEQRRLEGDVFDGVKRNAHRTLYFPKPAQIVEIQSVLDAEEAEDERHREATDRLRAQRLAVYERIRRVTPADIRHVQITTQQRVDELPQVEEEGEEDGPRHSASTGSAEGSEDNNPASGHGG